MRLPEIPYLRKEGRQTALICLLIVLVGLLCFGLGRLSAGFSGRNSSQPGTVLVGEDDTGTVLDEGQAGAGGAVAGGVVASKSGTKYHFPWCAGAKSIKEGNKVWFASTAEARAAGYEPAGNCKGLD